MALDATGTAGWTEDDFERAPYVMFLCFLVHALLARAKTVWVTAPAWSWQSLDRDEATPI